jgi:hypothetical protein
MEIQPETLEDAPDLARHADRRNGTDGAIDQGKQIPRCCAFDYFALYSMNGWRFSARWSARLPHAQVNYRAKPSLRPGIIT